MLTDATAVIIGYIGPEPTSALVGRTNVLRITVAVNRKANDPDQTLWFPVEIWGAKPALVARLRPGVLVRVVGGLFPEARPDGSRAIVVRYPNVLVLDGARPASRRARAADAPDPADVF